MAKVAAPGEGIIIPRGSRTELQVGIHMNRAAGAFRAGTKISFTSS
jgi:hypothetical protein